MIQLDNPGSQPLTEIPEPPRRNRERIGWLGMAVSLLVHAIFILLAIFVFFKWVRPPEEKVVDFLPGGGGGGNNGQTASKVQTQMRRAAATASARRISAEGATSTFSLPDNSQDMLNSSLPADPSQLASSGSGGGAGGGHGGGLGSGIGLGTGPGSGPGKGAGFTLISPFGSNTLTAGAMPGFFYDFKQTKDGKEIEGYNTQHYEDYTDKLQDVHRAGYKLSAFKKFFRAPEPLYLTQIAIPFSDASSGPSFFGVADKVKPAGWLVHYSGQFVPERDMEVRFVGAADDYIGVFVNGHTRLIAAWPGVRGLVAGRWEPREPIDEQAPTPIGACPVTKGEWVKMKKGQAVTLDIGIGECPGGKVGFVLMVEEKGQEYRTAGNGAPILPLFTTEPIKPEAKSRIIKDFPNWEFEWDKVPTFPVQSKVGEDL